MGIAIHQFPMICKISKHCYSKQILHKMSVNSSTNDSLNGVDINNSRGDNDRGGGDCDDEDEDCLLYECDVYLNNATLGNIINDLYDPPTSLKVAKELCSKPFEGILLLQYPLETSMYDSEGKYNSNASDKLDLKSLYIGEVFKKDNGNNNMKRNYYDTSMEYNRRDKCPFIRLEYDIGHIYSTSCGRFDSNIKKHTKSSMKQQNFTNKIKGEDMDHNELILESSIATNEHVIDCLGVLNVQYINGVIQRSLHILPAKGIVQLRPKFALDDISDDNILHLFYNDNIKWKKIYQIYHQGSQESNELLHEFTKSHTSIPHKVQSNSYCLADSSPPEVTSTVGRLADSSSNYLSLKGEATPRDRGKGGGNGDVTSSGSGLPESDPRELEAEVNREGSTPSGRTSSVLDDDMIYNINFVYDKSKYINSLCRYNCNDKLNLNNDENINTEKITYIRPHNSTPDINFMSRLDIEIQLKLLLSERYIDSFYSLKKDINIMDEYDDMRLIEILRKFAKNIDGNWILSSEYAIMNYTDEDEYNNDERNYLISCRNLMLSLLHRQTCQPSMLKSNTSVGQLASEPFQNATGLPINIVNNLLSTIGKTQGKFWSLKLCRDEKFYLKYPKIIQYYQKYWSNILIESANIIQNYKNNTNFTINYMVNNIIIKFTIVNYLNNRIYNTNNIINYLNDIGCNTKITCINDILNQVAIPINNNYWLLKKIISH